jgi:hypothetical protein
LLPCLTYRNNKALWLRYKPPAPRPGAALAAGLSGKFAGGGFDCVLGNLPWSASVKRRGFFATRYRDIAQVR